MQKFDYEILKPSVDIINKWSKQIKACFGMDFTTEELLVAYLMDVTFLLGEGN